MRGGDQDGTGDDHAQRRGRCARRTAEVEPPPGPAESADDTLQVFFLCAHPSLTDQWLPAASDSVYGTVGAHAPTADELVMRSSMSAQSGSARELGELYGPGETVPSWVAASARRRCWVWAFLRWPERSSAISVSNSSGVCALDSSAGAGGKPSASGQGQLPTE